jgi:hypothetical protein
MRHATKQINAKARSLLNSGTAANRREALALADDMTRCGAKTRQGTPCKAIGLGKGGRCKNHGGASTGPRTPEGLARTTAAMRAGRQRWHERQKAEKGKMATFDAPNYVARARHGLFEAEAE